MPADLVARFMQRATDMASTVERVESRAAIPAAVARYLDALELPPELAIQKSHAGVCWPEFADLDWRSAGLAIEARPTSGHDRLAHHRSVLRHRRNGHAGTHDQRGHADGIGAAAGYAHRRRSRGPRGLRDGRGVCAGPLRKRRHAACDEHDFRAVAHRRHRTDHRAWRAWTISRPSAVARLKRGGPRRRVARIPLFPARVAQGPPSQGTSRSRRGVRDAREDRLARYFGGFGGTCSSYAACIFFNLSMPYANVIPMAMTRTPVSARST